MISNNIINQISLMLTLTVLLISACTDVRDRKVPNEVTFAGMATGLILAAAVSPKEAGIRFLCLIFLFFFGMLRLMGMGDLKLCMAVTALRGPEEASLTLLFGAFMLLVYCLFTDAKNTVLMMKDTVALFTTGTPIPKRSDRLYPLAAFLALGYPAAWIATNVRW